jgi:hypothetical protein
VPFQWVPELDLSALEAIAAHLESRV